MYQDISRRGTRRTTQWYEQYLTKVRDLPPFGTWATKERYREYQQPVPAVPPLELEVNERLYLRTLHLNNQIDYGNQQQRFPYQRKANNRLAASVLPTVRHEMQEKAERHQGKHLPKAPYQLREKPRDGKS